MSTSGHNGNSEKEEGAAPSAGGNALDSGPRVGAGAIDGVGPVFRFLEQAPRHPAIPMIAVEIRKVRRCMAMPFCEMTV